MIPHNVNIFTGEAHQWYHGISEKYGPIARVGPTSLITSNANVWAQINTKPGYKRSKWYFEACRYSGPKNLELYDALLLDLLHLIRTEYLSHPSTSSGRIIPMDLSKKIQFLTLYVISAVGMGRGLRHAGRRHRPLRALERAGAAHGRRLLGARAQRAPLTGRWIAPKATDQSRFGALMGACFRVVDERRRDMLASFVRHRLEGDELKSEALETLIAGSDTTAGALRVIILYVMGNKSVYVKLQEEVDEAVRDGRMGADGEGVISYAVATQLPYLQAVIREGLRVFPPVRNILPKDVPAGGDAVMVDGKPVFLPGGVDNGYSALAMHRDNMVYGEDADLFRPERWFEPNQNKLSAMIKANELTFGHGRSQCLGKNVAQMELHNMKTFFELFRYFDRATVDPAKPWSIMNTLGIVLIHDTWVQVTTRSAEGEWELGKGSPSAHCVSTHSP
ncbi:cytochrome P450 [Parachaetomium inaequale]|uniref:Cytochrome P450 n=1 Tax=Parachaetomium inaequale TaxID=2588326 RepID=A0AAN6SSW0_9PEZI|nr:cytochrome P450 [Parachaetomium inaequale]